MVAVPWVGDVMYVYLAVYAVIAAQALSRVRTGGRVFFIFSGVFLVWFMGFRYETGCDYYGYFHRWINFDSSLSFFELTVAGELGFASLMYLVKSMGLSYIWFNVIVSAILVSCYIRFSSWHSYGPVILALLFPIVIIQLGMSGIRQALAGGFLMLAFNAFARGEKLWVAGWILTGAQFHASVAVFLPIVVLAGGAVTSLRLTAAVILLSPISAFVLGDRLSVYEDRYATGEVTSGGALIRYALLALPVPLFFRFRHRLKMLFPEVYPLLKLGVILIVSLAPLVIFSSIALHRLNYYVFPLSILIFVYVGAVLSKRPSDGHGLAILAYGSYSFLWFLSSRHAQSCYVPYENTWFM